MSLVEKAQELIRLVKVQEEYIRLARLYIAILETELKGKNDDRLSQGR